MYYKQITLEESDTVKEIKTRSVHEKWIGCYFSLGGQGKASPWR